MNWLSTAMWREGDVWASYNMEKTSAQSGKTRSIGIFPSVFATIIDTAAHAWFRKSERTWNSMRRGNRVRTPDGCKQSASFEPGAIGMEEMGIGIFHRSRAEARAAIDRGRKIRQAAG